MTDIQKLVFDYIQSIPSGRVMTYGLVADNLRKKKHTINGHLVGWVLHTNNSRDFPCHRIVDRNGRLAPNFAFDGAREQKRRLEGEGVTFLDDMHVDLVKNLWKG